MIRIPINRLIVEGPDLSGKTTLIKQIHKITNYRYNVTDRSSFSAVCFAQQFKRDDTEAKKRLQLEINDLNTFTVYLHLPFEILQERLKLRGDEIHNETSLRTEYDIMSKLANHLDWSNNFRMSIDEDAAALCRVLADYDSVDMSRVTDLVVSILDIEPKIKNNRITAQLEFYNLQQHILSVDASNILQHPEEGGYYRQIKTQLFNKMESERVYGASCRRLIYTGDSCISLIHVNCRQDFFEFEVNFRSTHIKKMQSDLLFLEHLVAAVRDHFRDMAVYHQEARVNLVMSNAHLEQ